MLLQMQGFFKDIKAIWKVLRQSVKINDCFVSRVLKNDMNVLLLVQKIL